MNTVPYHTIVTHIIYTLHSTAAHSLFELRELRERVRLRVIHRLVLGLHGLVHPSLATTLQRAESGAGWASVGVSLQVAYLLIPCGGCGVRARVWAK